MVETAGASLLLLGLVLEAVLLWHWQVAESQKPFDQAEPIPPFE